ncbi:TolC family protein [Methylophilus sp. Leaf408]|jgi:outer membrane protein TolC|uniref:TolC family protein n=1 Tax=Methylophilus sp. Leaf408 TaxID=2876561 RepID=UPI001E5C48AA|nr:TolC family protein [Methylophilus sp. Leaf408]
MSTNIGNLRARSAILVAVSLLLSGCATFTKDGGMNEVQKQTQPHLKQDYEWAKTEESKKSLQDKTQTLLTQPLDVEGAVQVALYNNKGLQASFYELGISEADLVQAGRLPNPRFSMLYARNGGEYKIEQAFTFNVFSLITMPKAVEVEKRRFAQAQASTAIEVLKLAYQTRVAYFNAVAATELAKYSAQVKESAEASAELAKRLHETGNWNRLEQIREQSFYADAALEYANARNAEVKAYEALARQLGVKVSEIKIQSRLPDLPKSLSELQAFEQNAYEQRLDLLVKRSEMDALANQLGLTKTTRFINVIELGPARVLEGRRGEPYKKGIDISFEIPLFDWSQAKVPRAESMYMQSAQEAAQLVINAQSEIRERYNTYRTKHDVTRHIRDEIVPLRKRILYEDQLRYNGMLTSPFELFGDARAQVQSVKGYIESLRDFWLADAELQATLVASPRLMEGQ